MQCSSNDFKISIFEGWGVSLNNNLISSNQAKMMVNIFRKFVLLVVRTHDHVPPLCVLSIVMLTQRK